MYFAAGLFTKSCYMRTLPSKLSLGLIAIIFSIPAFAQTVTISGNVSSLTDKSAVASASVTIKGTSTGTFTNSKGDFKLTTSQKLPLVLVITSIGYEAKEVAVADASSPLQISFKPTSILGAEIVVSATRSTIRSLESPVSIERIGATTAHEVPAVSFYDAIANLKGVDVVTSSLLFKTPGT